MGLANVTDKAAAKRDWITRNFEARQSITFRQRLRLGAPGDESWTLAGATFKMEVRPKSGGTVVVLLTDGNGRISIVNSETRLIELVIDAGTMQTVPDGVFQYDLIVFANGESRLRARGLFTILRAVTV